MGLGLALPLAAGAQGTFHGRKGQLRAAVPRLDDSVQVDGLLTEPAWSRAALLTGFSSYLPFDGRAADDSTEVMVWYSATAVYFGLRVYESHDKVHATLAARDRIDSDDYVQLLIDPFNDKRRAFVFGVNPFGAQADGIRTESGGAPSARGQTFGGNPPANIDLNPDFLFDSRGHVTEYGYEVEVRIPLKTLRFQESDPQDWGFQVLRYAQHSGYQQTWTPSRRGSASFLGQSGTLTGFHGLAHEQVVELNPEFTALRNGLKGSNGWESQTDASLGGNLRWRVVPNITMNATVRPDFSQVEADAAQIPGDTRFSLFFPEKRPFFVDGSEQFETPGNLIYTRRIVQPDAAVKFSGKFGKSSLAILSALDNRDASTSGSERPLFNLVRLRRDISSGSTLGLTLTDREEGTNFNRLGGADARLVFQKEYSANLSVATSSTRTASGTKTAPMWDLMTTRTGYRYGHLYTFSGVSPDFVAASGFVPRNDFVRAQAYHRVTFYGKPGSFLESWLIRQGADALWLYDGFRHGDGVQETKVQLENVLNVRGGWVVSITPVSESFKFDPRSYAGYRVLNPVSSAPLDTSAFTPSPRTSTAQVLTRVTTPQFRLFSGRFSSILGRDVDFFETAPTHRTDLTADIDFRPSAQLRLTTSYLYSTITRWRDNTTLSRANVPRLKVEYQISRPLYLRFVGQYDSRTRDALRNPSNDHPLVIRSNGVFALADRVVTRDVRADWLLSYVPSPGTVIFAGYGASLTEDEAFHFHQLERLRDGLFIKVSYLFRR